MSMLNNDDKNEIRKLVREEVRTEVRREVGVRTDPLRVSLVVIESKLEILKDIWSFIQDHTQKIDDHEERITHLESSQKF